MKNMEVHEALRKYNEEGKRFTYTDYAGWDDDNRYELIDGVVHLMSAPSATHQSILVELSRQIANYLIGKSCKVFVAPFDVCINGKGDLDDTVVQPDILVICDNEKIEDKYCNGAPDLTIEILSPSTSRHDRIVKLNKYLQAGVREYWIIDPVDKSVTVHLLENNKYIIHAYDETDTVAIHVLDDCNVALQDIFK